MATSYSFVSNGTVPALDSELNSAKLVVTSNHTLTASGDPFNNNMYEGLPSAGEFVVGLVVAALLTCCVFFFCLYVMVKVVCTDPIGIDTSLKRLSPTPRRPEQPSPMKPRVRLSAISVDQLPTGARAPTRFKREEESDNALAYQA
eukprot:6204372-Pleurochrysis_carterae.AAC.3